MAGLIDRVLRARGDEATIGAVREDVRALGARFLLRRYGVGLRQYRSQFEEISRQEDRIRQPQDLVREVSPFASDLPNEQCLLRLNELCK